MYVKGKGALLGQFSGHFIYILKLRMLSIITACSRPQNLKQIYESIDFSQVNKWYIVYDTSKCRIYDFQYKTEQNIIELSCDKEGDAGHPQINVALDLIKEGFVYIMDDDNIFHKKFWILLPTLDPEFVYTWDQNRIQEGRILKGGQIEERKIDTSQFIVPRNLIGSTRWIEKKAAGDFRFISQIYKKFEEKFKYISEVACYHNFIQKVRVAVCFFGLTRSLKFTLGSIEKYIFDPLKNHGIHYDTFLHTYKMKTPYSNPRAGEHDIILDADEYKLLEPTHHMVENKETVSKKLHLEKYRSHGNPWGKEKRAIPGDFSTLDNHILYLWSLKQLTNMWSKSRGKNYFSHIIYCRPDVLYQVPLDISWFSFSANSKKQPILIPNFALCGDVTDRFALGRPEQMLLYGNRFDDALAYSKKYPLASEAYLIATLRRHKIKYEHVNFYFTRVRANGEKDRLDVGQIRALTRRKRLAYKKKGTRRHFKGHVEISEL